MREADEGDLGLRLAAQQPEMGLPADRVKAWGDHGPLFNTNSPMALTLMAAFFICHPPDPASVGPTLQPARPPRP